MRDDNAVNLGTSLSGSFVMVNLGAGGDSDYSLPQSILKTITLIEADAGRQPIGTSNRYHQKHTIHGIIAGSKSPRRFTMRKFWQCSSLNEPRQEMVSQYGLEDYFQVESYRDITPITLSEIIDECSVDHIDYLKTDLEGEDFDVIKSCKDILGRILAIKCELRFQPFFRGEPYFHEVAAYLNEHDYDLIGLKPAYWKPLTAHVKNHRDGRVVYADCLFMKRMDAVRKMPADTAALAAAKQVIIAVMAGKKSYAEWLIDQYQDLFPDSWQHELRSLALPHPIGNRMLKITRFASLTVSKINRLRCRILRPNKDERTFDHSYAAPQE